MGKRCHTQGPMQGYDDIQREMNRILEEQLQFSRALEQIADPLREIREAIEQGWHRATQLERFSLSKAAESASSLARSIEQEFENRRLRREVFEALHRPELDTALASVLRHREELAEITAAAINRSFESITAPAHQVQSALAALEASARLYSVPPTHWSNSLSIIASYEQFAIRQTKKLETDTPTVAKRRARVTELAGDLLEASLSANATAASESDSDAPAIEPVKPQIFGPLNSHVAYVYRATIEVDIDLAVADALPFKICHFGYAIVMAVTRINETLRRRGEEEIFKPTNRSLRAASVISAVVVDTESEFANVVDALFFLLYEGSGAKSSRLTSRVSEEDLQPLRRLNSLRLNYRHDIEHGDSKEIARKHRKIGDTFITLVGKRLPARPAEWTSAQAKLYQQLFGMLVKVEEAVNAI